MKWWLLTGSCSLLDAPSPRGVYIWLKCAVRSPLSYIGAKNVKEIRFYQQISIDSCQHHLASWRLLLLHACCHCLAMVLANDAHCTSQCVVTMPACIASGNMLVPLCSEDDAKPWACHYSPKNIYHWATQISQSRLLHNSTGIADALSRNLLTTHWHQQEMCCAPTASGSSRVQRTLEPHQQLN